MKATFSQLSYIPAERLVVEVIEETSASELTRCPHCSATGRSITWFITSDGEKRGAIVDCYSKYFYQHPNLSQLEFWNNQLRKHPNWKRAMNEVAKWRRVIGVPESANHNARNI